MSRQPSKTLKEVENEASVKGEKPQRALVVERDQTGLYYCRMSGGGKIPDMLQGKFTSINTINDLVRINESK